MKVSAIVVGHGDEPLLLDCLTALVAQLDADDEVVLVDHGIRTVPGVERVRVVTPATNGGFGSGCASGAAASTGAVLVFVNSDAIVQRGALAALQEAVAEPGVGLAGGLVLLADRPDTIDSAGLPVHLSGLSWCDAYGEPAAARSTRRTITSVAGALFACRREVWERLGGLDEQYFMYHEDTDLSLRSHLAGLDVVLVPGAMATHAHDFSRNPRKMFLLERNRFLTVIGDYPTHLLLRVLPVLLLLEPLYLVIAARDGWAREKLEAWGWLLGHAPAIARRRRRVQSRVVSSHALDDRLSATITQTQLDAPAAMGALNGLLAAYWKLVRPRPEVGR